MKLIFARIPYLRKPIKHVFVVALESGDLQFYKDERLRILFCQMLKSICALDPQPLHSLVAGIGPVHSHAPGVLR